jgi:hypothetical protein
MGITIGNVITLGLAVVSFIFGYATVIQRVKQLETQIAEIDTLRKDIRSISDTLQNLMGKLDIFIKIQCDKKE